MAVGWGAAKYFLIKIAAQLSSDMRVTPGRTSTTMPFLVAVQLDPGGTVLYGCIASRCLNAAQRLGSDN